MATLDGSTTTKKGQEIVTASYPGGKILETSIVAVGSPSGPVAVGTATGDKRMPVDALATLESTQMTDLLAGFTTVATAFTDVATEIAAHTQTAAETSVDSTGLTALTTSPGAAFAQLQELAEALDGVIGFLRTAILPSGGTTGQQLVKTSGSDYATGWDDPARQVLQSLGVPDDADGVNGDLNVSTASPGSWYVKVSGAWVSIGALT